MQEGLKIPILSWVDDIIQNAFKSVYTGVDLKVERARKSYDILGNKRANYYSQLEKTCSAIQILGMSEAIPIDRLYVETYVSETIARNSFVDAKAVLEQKGFKDNIHLNHSSRKGINFISLIDNHKKIVILGRPGSGKTTVLKHLVVSLCDQSKYEKLGLSRKFLPIYINARNYALSEKPLSEYILEIFNKMGFDEQYLFFERLISNGNCLFLIDGIDEIPNNYAEISTNEINAYMERYDSNHYIMTCRHAAYGYDMNNVKIVEILDFTKTQSDSFIDRWFHKAPDLASKLKSNISKEPKIIDLTTNPLLLSLICILYENDLVIHRAKYELYDRCVSVMIREWDRTRRFIRDKKFDSLSEDRRIRLLSYIASKITLEGKYIIPEVQLNDFVGEYIIKLDLEKSDAKDVINEIEAHHSILLKPVESYYCFAHISFQEFFAAKDIVANNTATKIIKDFLHNEMWEDIFALVIAMTEKPDDIMQYIFQVFFEKAVNQATSANKRLRAAILLYKGIANQALISKETKKLYIDGILDYLIEIDKYLASKDIYTAFSPRTNNRTLTNTFGYYLTPQNPLKNENLLKLLVTYNNFMRDMYNDPIDLICNSCEDVVEKEEFKYCLLSFFISLIAKKDMQKARKIVKARIDNSVGTARKYYEYIMPK